MEQKIMDIAFYQLLRTPLEKALPKLLEKVYQSGFRVLVVCESQEKMEILNTVLWTFSTTAFLPHGSENVGIENAPKRHPIWLSLTPENSNEATIVVVTNGVAIPKDQVGTYAKCLDIFDGNDPDQTNEARSRYIAYKDQGYPLTFWKQTPEGSWEKEG